MKKNRTLAIVALLLVIVLISLISNRDKLKKQPQTLTKSDTHTTINPYINEYSGGYMINVTGMPKSNNTEMYVLHANGKAEWMWIELKSGKTNILSKKVGTWNATENSISIDISGNTGPIKETYTYTDGRFSYGSRYLVKTTK